jgi:hypothetical protein
VNRLWKLFFGTGLSKVLDDFGAQGEPPVNPELLDWLACEFMESGWNVKHMVRLIVTSGHLSQSSQPEKEHTPRSVHREPWRAIPLPSRRRLVRDNAWRSRPAVGRLAPGVKPYQPPVTGRI